MGMDDFPLLSGALIYCGAVPTHFALSALAHKLVGEQGAIAGQLYARLDD
jgi:hypothetical protein